MKMLHLIVLVMVFTGCCCLRSSGQAGTGMKIGDAHQKTLDSLQTSGYPWRFPLMGAKVAKKGFNLPYSVGAMLNYFAGSQEVLISDLEVGVNNSELVPFDFIEFGEVRADIQTLNARMDLWLLPFLDVYGILGKVWTKTNVEVTAPVHFNNTTRFGGYTYGMGVTLAGGYHGIITINDINFTWTDLDKLSNKVKTLMISPRIGYNFLFHGKPGQSFAVWIGATGAYINKGTEGEINVSDLTANIPREKIDEIVDETTEWYQQLRPAQQVVVKQIAEKIKEKMDGRLQDMTIHYSLRKDALSTWTMLAGGQFQFNPRWQARVEIGFLGGRKSGLLSANYRWRW